jgi:hypothetical protein
MFLHVMDIAQLSTILQTAPAWARLGLTVGGTALRERAADALAATIIRRLDEPERCHDTSQLPPPLYARCRK